jgi:predicted PurR-regulated permease PerM
MSTHLPKFPSGPGKLMFPIQRHVWTGEMLLTVAITVFLVPSLMGLILLSHGSGRHTNKFQMMYIGIQFVLHRKHITSPLQSPASEFFGEKQSFIARTNRNTLHSDQVQVILRPTVSQIDRLGIGNFLCLTIFFFLMYDGSALCSTITHWLESRRTHNHTLLSHLRLSQPGGPGPRIYIPQEQGGPVIPPGTGFPFRRLLRLARIRRRYSNPPPHRSHDEYTL